MIGKIEYESYRAFVESPETMAILVSMDPDGISKVGGEAAGYYARVSGSLADIKDEIMRETFLLSQKLDEKGKPMAMARAEVEGELSVNARHEVTRRQIDYLLEALDKISFACSARIRAFSKEGNF